MAIKPQLAINYDNINLKFPLWIQPKLDGVRGINLNGTLVGRSLKSFKNKALTEKFSKPQYHGFDGELCCGIINGESLCRDTTSKVNTIKGDTDGIIWYVFDYVTDETIGLPYKERYAILQNKVDWLNYSGDHSVRMIGYHLIETESAMNSMDAYFLKTGMEGSILRNPDAIYKEGRSSKKVQEILRIKRFEEEEAIVLEVIEGRHNLNEATTNELGHTERSSHKDNQVPNGMVGALTCRDIKTDAIITVSAGAMVHDERVHYFQNQSEIIGKVIKYRTFKKGVKDMPRFPTFHSIRVAEDIG